MHLYHKIFRSGFSKDCKCCRESGYAERTLTLKNCYDQDGHKIESGSHASMQVKYMKKLEFFSLIFF